jgi:hypothetical protein
MTATRSCETLVPPARLHVVTVQKTTLDLYTAVRTEHCYHFFQLQHIWKQLCVGVEKDISALPLSLGKAVFYSFIYTRPYLSMP